VDGISLPQIIIIGVIILILFGANKLPVFGQSIGKAIRGFKQGLNEIDAEAKDVSKQLDDKSSETAKTTATTSTSSNKS
jgi:TatA/E family protein of Tat protein translocase